MGWLWLVVGPISYIPQNASHNLSIRCIHERLMLDRFFSVQWATIFTSTCTRAPFYTPLWKSTPSIFEVLVDKTIRLLIRMTTQQSIIHRTQHNPNPKMNEDKNKQERWDNINESKKKKAYISQTLTKKRQSLWLKWKRRSTTRYFRLQQKLGFR